MVRLAITLGILVLAIPARADSPKLAEAQRAVDDVRFDDARRLLVEAVADGGNSPAGLAKIYELSASTAIVLNQRELAEQYYRRWLALEPAAKLADGASPKLQEVFVAAQAYMGAHGRLAVKAERRATAIDVVVESDPLAMATASALDAPGAAPVAFGADHHAHLEAPVGAARVFVLDDRGNHLAELAVAEPTRAPEVIIPPPETPERPFSRQWTTWAVPSAAFLVGGAVLGTIAITEQDNLKAAISKSGDHFFGDVSDDHKAIKRNATIGIALGSVGALLAIPAAVFYVHASRPWNISRLSLVPTAHGLGLAGAF